MIAEQIKTMTPQEVFDKVAEHLMSQLEQSLSDTMLGGCMYLNREGLQCAAGCLIAEDEYDEAIEEQDWDKLVSVGLVPTDHQTLIQGLQLIHDNIDPKNWGRELHEYALVNELEYKQ